MWTIYGFYIYWIFAVPICVHLGSLYTCTQNSGQFTYIRAWVNVLNRSQQIKYDFILRTHSHTSNNDGQPSWKVEFFSFFSRCNFILYFLHVNRFLSICSCLMSHVNISIFSCLFRVFSSFIFLFLYKSTRNF